MKSKFQKFDFLRDRHYVKFDFFPVTNDNRYN